jgi:hypothetical protein
MCGMTGITITAGRSDGPPITQDKAAFIVASGGGVTIIASGGGQFARVSGGNVWKITAPKVTWLNPGHTDAEGAYMHSEVVKIASRIARAAGKSANLFDHLPPWVKVKLDTEVTKGYSPRSVCEMAALAYHDGDRTHDSAWRYAIERTLEGETAPPLWTCGCLKNKGGAHRVGCPDHPEGVQA